MMSAVQRNVDNLRDHEYSMNLAVTFSVDNLKLSQEDFILFMICTKWRIKKHSGDVNFCYQFNLQRVDPLKVKPF